MTLGAVCHFHAEPHALPGFIAEAERTFDEIVLVSSPMDGTPPDPETIRIAEASGHKLIHDTLSQGFGALRTRCISYSTCDWVMILDADERVWSGLPKLTCEGDEKFPDTRTPRLPVGRGNHIDQRALLRNTIIQAEHEGSLAVCMSRRHWFNSPEEGFVRPCQNWRKEYDWQLRCIRNTPFVFFDPSVPMHEKLLDTRTWADPKFLRVTSESGPFIDHYSLHFKQLEPEQNTEDANAYEQLQPGCVNEMWLRHFPKS